VPSGVWAVGVAVLTASAACGGASTPPPAPASPPAAAPASPPPPGRRPVRLSYLAPSDCPTVDGYLSHVRARSTSLELQERGTAAADSVDVRLDPDLERPGWLGQLRIEGSRPLEREVRGERCQDVVEALALITVLRLEGGDAGAGAGSAAAGAASGAAGATGASVAAGATAASGTAAAAAEAQAAAPASPPPTAEPGPSEPRPQQPVSPTPSPAETPESAESPGPAAATAPATEASPTDEAPDASPPAPGPPASASAPSGSSVLGAAAAEEPSEPPLRPDEPITVPADSERVEADSEASDEQSEPLHAQLAPSLALLAGYASVPGHALELTLASEVRYGETLGSWTSPIALTVTLGNERVDAADLDFTLLTAQLGLCPPALLAESWAWLRLCGSVRGGAVRAEITPRVAELEDDPASWRPWLAVVPSLEIGIPLSEHWTLRANAELAVQLVRDTFGAALDEGPDPDVLPLYEPDALSFEGGLGVGYTF